MKDKKYKIAMIGHKRIPSREGGIEIVVEKLSTKMAALGHNVVCYNRNGVHVSGEEYDNKVKLREYKGVKLKYAFTIDKKGAAAVISSFSATLRSIFCGFDVIHFHAEGPSVAIFIPHFLGIRTVVTVHGLDWARAKWKNGFGSKYIKLGERMAVKYADEIIVLSRNVQKYFKDTYNRDTVYIPNGVDKPLIKKADEITRRWGLKKDDYILFLGRIVPEKGIKHLVEAFKGVNTDKKLVIAGGASNTDDFMREIESLARADKRVIMTGFIQGNALEELYSNAYIYTLPSEVEGMPLSLLEAMSYGNCCLTSDIAECAAVVEDMGVTFKVGNVEDLRRVLQELCDNSSIVKKYRSNVRDVVCNKYNWDDVVKKTLEMYKSNSKH